MAQVRAAVGGIVGRSPAGGKVIDMSNEGGKYVARVPHGELDESDQRYLDMFFDRMELVKQNQEETLKGLQQAREVQKYGGALPGTPQWEDSWQKVKANDLQGRVLTNVLGQLDDMSKPSYYNPPNVEGVQSIPKSDSLGEDFSGKTGIYQTRAPVRQGGRLIDAGAFSNIGSRPGPAKINTPEGEAQFEGLKAITGAITGKGEGKIDRFRQTPDQKFLSEQYKVKATELKGLTDINDPDGVRRAALQSEMKDIEERYTKERAKLGPNAGGFPKQEKEAWPGGGEEKAQKTDIPHYQPGPYASASSWRNYQNKPTIPPATSSPESTSSAGATKNSGKPKPLTISMTRPEPDTEEAKQLRRAVSNSMGKEGLKRAQAQFNADVEKGFGVDESLIRIAKTFGQAVAKLISDNFSQPVEAGMVRTPQYYKGPGSRERLLSGLK